MSLYVAAIDSAISHSNHNSDREFNSMRPRSEPIGPQVPGHRPDQGIHRADTPHTGASGAWLSFDGHTYVLIY